MAASAEFDVERAFETMLTIRRVEERLLDLFASGELNGTVHTCIGQESIAVGVTMALDSGRDHVFSNHRSHGHYIGFGGPIEGLVAEIMGRRNGVCGGRGGSQHLCWHNFLSNGILGGMIPVACGVAMGTRTQGTGGVACVFVGDGAFGEGIIYESLNIAGLWQLPILFVVEDNGYAQTTPKSMAMAGSIPARIAAFDIAVTEHCGGNAGEVFLAAHDAVAVMRNDGKPRALVFSTYRLAPHSKGDDFRDATEIQAAMAREPLKAMAVELGQTRAESCRQACEDRVSAAFEAARNGRAAELADGAALSHLLPCTYQVPPLDTNARISERLNVGLHAALGQDSSVIVLGEDILDPYGGAFKVTKGISTKFPDRILGTPISEAAIVGFATGASLTGLRPVVEIMFGDFCGLITDQVLNHAAKFRWMYNNQVSAPILIRTPVGGRRGYGPTHSQSIERIFFGIPGLRVVSISTLWDPADTLLTCLSQDDPVLLLENKVAYGSTMQEVPVGFVLDPPQTPLGPLHVRRADSGQSDVTIVAYGGMETYALTALSELLNEEIAVDLVIPQQLSPLDPLLEAVRDSVGSSGCMVVCEEGTGPWGFGAELITKMHEGPLAGRLRAARVAAPCIPIPNSRELEAGMLPDHRDIIEAVEHLLVDLG